MVLAVRLGLSLPECALYANVQVDACNTGVMVSYSISNRFYNMIVGLTQNAWIVEGSVDIDIYSTDISIFEQYGVWVRGLYNGSYGTPGTRLSGSDTVRLHSAYFDGSQPGDVPHTSCVTRNTTAIMITDACNQVAVITPRFTTVCQVRGV